jgi:RNA polymerase sigma factor (sigma-70 family)
MVVAEPKTLDMGTTPLTDDQVAALVMEARDTYAREETPRVNLDDDLVNDLAIRARAGDEMARELVVYWGARLIAPHPKHVQWVRYADVGPEDMWQEGRVVLMTAISKYDGTRGHNFGAYAARIISNALGEWAESHSLAIAVPRHARRRLRKEGVVNETTQRAKAAETLPRYLSTIMSAGDADADKHAPFASFDQMPEQADPFDLENDVVARETRQHVQDAFYALEPTYQQVLYCRHVAGMSVDRTHKHLHLGMGTLRALEREALAILQSSLQEYLSDADDSLPEE